MSHNVGRLASNSLMAPVPVVVMAPFLEHVGTFQWVVINEALGPFMQGWLDEAFGLAIGQRPIGLCKAVLHVYLTVSSLE